VTCPCGTGLSFEECCGPYLEGKSKPATAEALMRSRYTAYAKCDIDYIASTYDPDSKDEMDRKTTEAWSKQSEWLGLEVLKTEKGTAEDDTGVVEFLARYKIKNTTINHRERATFRKANGRWVFVDGQEISGPPVVNEGPRIGRNDACPCGSGKKYKKCCGKNAA